MGLIYVPVQTTPNLTSFTTKLKKLTDKRDNRGKRHELAFVLGGGAGDYVGPVVCFHGTSSGLSRTGSSGYVGYWATHKGLVVLAGQIRDQLRQSRHHQLTALAQQLVQVRTQIGQPRLRTVKAVQRQAQARLRASQVGHLMSVSAYQTETGQVDLRWQIDSYALWQAQ